MNPLAAHLHPAWRVIAVPWQRRRNQGSMWPIAVIVLLIAVPVLGLVMMIPRLPLAIALAMALVIVVGALAMLAWAWFVISLMPQNEPHAARLVPGHLRQLRIVWLTGLAAITALLGALGACFGLGLPVALGAAVLMLVISWLARWPWLGMAVWVASALVSRIAASPPGRALGDLMAQAWRDEPVVTAVAAALAIVAIAVASMFTNLQSGDARHVRNYRRRTASATGSDSATMRRTEGLGSAPGDQRLNALRRVTAWPYRLWLMRASDARHGSVLSRALLGLGPGLHWSGLASAGLLFGLWFGVVALLLYWLYPSLSRLSTSALFWSSIALLGWLGSAGGQARGAIYRSRREQALLMLLPGMPRGAALNRPLAQRLLLQYMLAWAMSGALALAVIGTQPAQLDWLISFGAACLWPAAWMCADWSRMPAPSVSTTVLPALLPVALALTAHGLQAWLGVPMAVCAGLLATGAVGATAWRYRRAVRAPSAFPAARR